MFAFYDVMICNAHKMSTLVLPRLIPKVAGRVRRYFIAIIEDNWEYCPVKIDPVSKKSLFDPET